MDTRRKRQVIIASIVAGVLLVVAAAGTGAFLIIRDQHRDDDVNEATRVATAFDKDVSRYRSDVSRVISSADRSNAREMRTSVDKAVADVPELGDAPTWGRTHSKAYIRAQKAEKTLKEPYQQLSTVLDEAVVGQPFIKAGRKALTVKADDFVTERILPNGSRIRDELIPGFEKALARFNKAKIPRGQAALARKIRQALEATIDDAEQLADNLDAGSGGQINPQEEYTSASAALIAYDYSLRSRIKAAVETATGEVSGELTET